MREMGTWAGPLTRPMAASSDCAAPVRGFATHWPRPVRRCFAGERRAGSAWRKLPGKMHEMPGCGSPEDGDSVAWWGSSTGFRLGCLWHRRWARPADSLSRGILTTEGTCPIGELPGRAKAAHAPSISRERAAWSGLNSRFRLTGGAEAGGEGVDAEEEVGEHGFAVVSAACGGVGAPGFEEVDLLGVEDAEGVLADG